MKRILHTLALPALLIARHLHRPHFRLSRRATHCLIGLILVLLGVIIAKNAPHDGPAHIIVDAIGYCLHGLGFAPTAKVICEILSVEI